MAFRLTNKVTRRVGVIGTILAALMLAAPAAQASSATAGTISSIQPASNGQLLFNQSGTRTALPGCATIGPAIWAIDVTQPGGQAMAAVLLTAYSTGKQIIISGSGACTIQPQTETVWWILVQP